MDVVQAFASDETHKDANCAVLFILSHGGNEVIDIQAPRVRLGAHTERK